MDQLGIYAQVDSTVDPITPKNTTLHQFENALANMTALMYWAGITMYFTYLPHPIDTLIPY